MAKNVILLLCIHIYNRLYRNIYALWLGPLPAGVNSNLPAESILGCPVKDDRYGPGNNKSKQDRENEMRSSPPLFSADTPQPSGISEPSYTAAVALGAGERSGKELLWLLYM